MPKKVFWIFLLVFIFLVLLYGTGREAMLAVKVKAPVFPQKPKKIVSLSLAADEMLLSLVDKSRIKALTYLSIDPQISNVDKEAQGVEEHIKLDLEKVIALQPDLVITSTFTPAEVIVSLREAALPVYVFQVSNSLQQIKANILAVARVVGESEKGEALIKEMEAKERRILRKVHSKPRKPWRVLHYGINGDTMGENTQFDEFVRKLGLRNAASEVGIKGIIHLPKERLIQLNPQIIFVPRWTQQKDFSPFQEELLQDPSLASVEAVKKRRIYQLPDQHFTCFSQYIMLGMEDLAKLVYPEVFE